MERRQELLKANEKRTYELVHMREVMKARIEAERAYQE